MYIVEFIVGGVRFSLSARAMSKDIPTASSAAMKKEWHDGNKMIQVERNGDLEHCPIP